MNTFNQPVDKADSEVFKIMQKEKQRQNFGLEMIPSESFASVAVLNALGSVMTNKYSEGYPKKRYYGGNEFIDEMETLAIERCKKVFGCEHVNVQPYSGSPANLEAYHAVLDFNDKVLAMSLAHGGHLTHGHKVNFSGKAYSFAQYGVDEKTELLDMDVIRKQAKEEKPKLILSGATAYPRTIDFKEFHEIAEEVGAYSMADVSHISGLIAGGVHESPVPHMDIVTSTTHKTLCGPRGAIIMSKIEDRHKEKFHPKSKLNLANRIDKAVFPGMQGGPHNHQIAAKAVAFGEALKPEFKNYASQIVKNAKALAEELTTQEIRLVSGGTDNHLILADLSDQNISGSDAETALDKVGITLNKNMVPFDKRSPFDPSGIRFGTPALTSRGMKEEQMKRIGEWMAKIIKDPTNNKKQENIRTEIKEMCSEFPLYE